MKVAFILLLGFCSLVFADAGNHITLSNIAVTEYGTYISSDAKLCEGFRLSNKEAKAFLSKAVVVTDEQRHSYSWLPCFVRGKAKVSNGEATWEIQPLGTGLIYLPGGASSYVADEAQKDIQE